MRDKSAQWYVSHEQWPDDTYPIWYQGLVYILTTPLTKQISSLAAEQPYLFLDDVFIGVVVSKVPDVKYLTIQDISAVSNYYNSEKDLLTGLYSRFYSDRDLAIFYHVPCATLFTEWWRCQAQSNCKHPCTIIACISASHYVFYTLFVLFIVVFTLRRFLQSRYRSIRQKFFT